MTTRLEMAEEEEGESYVKSAKVSNANLEKGT